MREEVVLDRDVEVTAIPYGDRISLQKGHPVIITQALGGSYTLVTMQGYMVRLDGPDADAIGKEPQAPPTAEEIASKSLGDLVWDHITHGLGIPIAAATPVLAIALTIPVVLILVNLIAYLPARNAAQTRPAVALRTQ